MKNEAVNAYRSNGFQDLVECIAGLITNNKIEEAVRTAGRFLIENQEFCLLNSDEIRGLMSDALAARGIFNESIIDHTATLMWKTNCKANKETIVKEWKLAAVKSECPPLVENVGTLEKSDNFERDYEAFLEEVFMEDLSTREVRASAYLSALKEIKKVLSSSEGDE